LQILKTCFQPLECLRFHGIEILIICNNDQHTIQCLNPVAGGNMKALVIKRKKNTSIIITSALMLVSILVIIAFALESYGAGAPKTSSSESQSAAEKRAEANTYFDQGKRYQDQENFKEAASSYIQLTPKHTVIWDSAIASSANLTGRLAPIKKPSHSTPSWPKPTSIWAKPTPRWGNLTWPKKSFRFYEIWDPMKPMNWKRSSTKRGPTIDGRRAYVL